MYIVVKWFYRLLVSVNHIVTRSITHHQSFSKLVKNYETFINNSPLLISMLALFYEQFTNHY